MSTVTKATAPLPSQTSQVEILRRRIERLQALFFERKERKPRVLILGAGYAGVKCALGLQGLEAEVTLVNENDYHYLTTLMHEPAVGRRDFNEVSVDLPSLLEDTSIAFLKGKVVDIDPDRQLVHIERPVEQKELGYDFLVIALGSKPAFFGIPGLEEHAWTLNNWREAVRLKLKAEETTIDFKENPDEPWRGHIVIGGAGLTGVELAGELADWCAHLSKQYGIPKGKLRITLIDASPTVLNACKACQDKIIDLATRTLERKGVKILTEERAKSFEQNRINLESGETFQAGLIVWTGGVQGNPLLEAAGLEVNRQKRAVVNEYLQAKGHPEIFVIGDSAAGTTEDGAVLPPTAQVAVHQGDVVAENFHRAFSCQPMKDCAPKMMGVFLSIGHKDALGVLQNKFHFKGWQARWIKNMIGYRYLASLGGWKMVAAKLTKSQKPVKSVYRRFRREKPSFAKRVLDASVAGLLGTFAMTTLATLATAFGYPMDTPAMLSDFLKLPLGVGWLMHGMIGIMLGWGYALVRRALPGPPVLCGILYGMVPFLLAQVVMMPMMGAGYFAANMGAAAGPLVLGSLMGHGLYGAVLGWVYDRN